MATRYFWRGELLFIYMCVFSLRVESVCFPPPPILHKVKLLYAFLALVSFKFNSYLLDSSKVKLDLTVYRVAADVL